MNRQQIAALISYIAGLDPRTSRTGDDLADQLDQWCEVLRDVPPRAPHPNGRHWNAAEVAHRHVTTSPYPILPADIARPWNAFRADIMRRHADPVPAADPDNPAAWCAELATARNAVATGAIPAAPLRELTGGTREERDAEAAAVLARLGTYVPRTVRNAIAPRTRTVSHGQPTPGPERLPHLDALAVACPRPDCRALPNRRCKRASGAERRLSVHDERQAAYAALVAEESA